MLFQRGLVEIVEATVSTEAHQAPSVLIRRLVVWRLEVGGAAGGARYPKHEGFFVAVFDI